MIFPMSDRSELGTAGPELRAPRRAVGVFAHPDDEVICAGGTMAKWSAAGTSIAVVCATRGEAGQIRDATTAVRRTLGRVREGELRHACAHLGVSQVTVLDYADGALGAVEQDALAAHVGTLLADADPDVIITFGDDGAYGHPDHIAISNATTTAVTHLQATTWSSRSVPVQLLRSYFPSSRISLAERLADWLVSMERPFGGSADYGRALTLFAEEAATMRFASDDVRIVWYPSGSLIVEQDEPATSLLLILSGTVDVAQEGADGVLHHLRTLGEGEFFGELGVAGRRARAASVIAKGNVTCLELSTTERTKFDGRGATATRPTDVQRPTLEAPLESGIVRVDVTAHLDSKLAALTAHRSQYPIDVDAFPRSMLLEMYGTEYFAVVPTGVSPPRRHEANSLGAASRRSVADG
jgi:LmbE family N-acetylglucosaminyl deacetylase